MIPDDLPDKDEHSQHLEFIFPNLWQNYILKNMRVLAAFVPVNENKTIMYLRFYQGFVKLPILKDILNLIFMPYNLRIAHEDRRVVTTHAVPRSDLNIEENLFQADHPIIAYRRRRNEIINSNKENKG
jgi:phenylpropionate dioxygenase-like ring-hydroxylating dioxygenase large terminal subunit